MLVYTQFEKVVKLLNYPFKWVHTYIPIMSNQMLKYLEKTIKQLTRIKTIILDDKNKRTLG